MNTYKGCGKEMKMGIYDYAVTNAKGEKVSLKTMQGKVIMIVNTATGCGFTPQYKELEEMYEKYHHKLQ